MEDFLRGLLSLSIGGSLIAALILLLRGSIRSRLPKSFYYYAWLLVLLRLILPIPGRLELPEASAPVIEFMTVERVEPPEVSPTLPQRQEEAPAVEAAPRPTQSRPVPQTVPAAPAEQDAAPKLPDLSTVLCIIWAAGFLFCLSRDLLGYFRFRHAIHRTLIRPEPSDLAIYWQLTGPRRPRLYRTSAVDTPMLMGLLHPTLLLPDRRYSPEILECIFRHELVHYQRRDILYKWFSVPVLAVHWFNPLTIFIRRDIDRCCELSCDERLLKEMDHDQRKSYGETLLVLAARSAPSRTVLSTTFATEKKKLKERLVHIMNFKPNSQWAITAAALLLIAVGICAVLFGPQRTGEPEAPEATETMAELQTEPTAAAVAETEFPMPEGARTVTTVDEFLAAIGSDTEIILAPGVYDLTTARDYGDLLPSDSPYYWTEINDGFQLVIRNVENLAITGSDIEVSEIVTSPRYAAVVCFENCTKTSVSNITAGHTDGPGHCNGAVIELQGCQDTFIRNCDLYGCGTYGIQALFSNFIDVSYSNIRDCSLGAAWLMECQNVKIHHSSIFGCGTKEYPCYDLFAFNKCLNSAVYNCEIRESYAGTMVLTEASKNIYFVSNHAGDGSTMLFNSVFDINGASPIVDGCIFSLSQKVPMITAVPTYTANSYNERVESTVQSLDGKELTGESLRVMAYEDFEFTLPPLETSATATAPAGSGADTSISTDGTRIVEAATVDEFLAAIAPNTTVVLPEGTFDLSTASDYGTGWETYYRWVDVFDGFELEIMKIDNFHIQGAGQNKTILAAIPRYAEVLLFTDCTNISVSGITAGHTEEPGYCTGGVLTYERCQNVAIDGCGLYGCGIFGVTAFDSRNFAVTNTEIYDCSYGAVELQNCEDMAFDNCYIHDCPMPYFGSLRGCTNITLNGAGITGS